MEIRPDHIITRPEILGLLKRVYENHSLLTIKIDDQSATYSSTILGIDTRKNLILIDDLFPSSGDKLERLSTLHCFTRLDGICINFSCPLKATTSRDTTNNAHQVTVPNKIHYHQRRRHYRVPLNWTAASMSASIESHEFTATVVDISASGIGAKLNSIPDIELDKNLLLSASVITIPNFQAITTSLIIRAVRSSSPDNSIYLGAEFTRLDSNQIKQIQHLVAQLDRESCQIRTLSPRNANHQIFG